MITEMTMETCNNYAECVRLPMPTFCMLYKHMRKLSEEKFNRNLLELCSVSAVAYAGPAYKEALENHYKSLLLNEKQRVKAQNPFLFDMSDKKQADQAASIMASTLRKKAQLMGLTVGNRERQV